MKSSKKKEPATTASSSGKPNFPSSIADKTPIPKVLPDFEAMKTEKLPEGATVVAGFVLDSLETAQVIHNLQIDLEWEEAFSKAHNRALNAVARLLDRAVQHIEMLEGVLGERLPDGARWAAICPKCIAHLKEVH